MSHTAIVEINGTRYYRGDDILQSGSVTLRRAAKKKKAGSHAEVTLSDPRLEIIDSLPFVRENARLAFEVWFGEGPAPPKVFSGYCTKYQTSGRSLSISATDKGKGLRRKTKAKNRANTELLAFIAEVAKAEDLTVDVSRAELTGVSVVQRIQHGETDWEVLTQLLGSFGHYAFITPNGVLTVAKEGATFSTGVPVIEYTDVEPGFSFSQEEKTKGNTANVADYTGAVAGEDSSEEAFDRPVVTERTGLSVTEVEFPSQEGAALQRALASAANATKVFEASVTITRPRPEIIQDSVVLLRRFGRIYSGAWKVEMAEHDLRNGTTSLSLFKSAVAS